jgi:hypothetical protein
MLQVRNLILVLGDQLDSDAAAFDGFDAAHGLSPVSRTLKCFGFEARKERNPSHLYKLHVASLWQKNRDLLFRTGPNHF